MSKIKLFHLFCALFQLIVIIGCLSEDNYGTDLFTALFFFTFSSIASWVSR